ncbi:conserved hypothetical protein [Coccidioides posadasii str. Silveira]|uniref:Uncharacterized protein n=1 Tax=Coccidioides posadasii (strain RMSCC 757 / Silveira) TaxID=443226 RepID=E9CZH2_COCPS|nr:conserved hypothetical protein [Coccidioides posadasii str. Silveira]
MALLGQPVQDSPHESYQDDGGAFGSRAKSCISGFTEFSGPVFPIFLVTFVSTDSHTAWLAEIQYCSSANMNKRGPNNGCYLGCYQTPKSKM